ncbi:hypothetical protein CMQ_2935 [Grosmannia clavigera kw1407]|uniref:Uncharacterized protein n=1 Tax=Grosmannia clavigera (strain kw1407 / UAMH 11150) TaxID=655863 RepID=F0XGR9_GROCL|nr:uncharacterized protein CMQ_2935 [Grosmannia clavigera kw1407]EFX03006.1 hypothetical protein CMQ_2935 [Grosmannia clavigera kw1407]
MLLFRSLGLQGERLYLTCRAACIPQTVPAGLISFESSWSQTLCRNQGCLPEPKTQTTSYTTRPGNSGVPTSSQTWARWRHTSILHSHPDRCPAARRLVAITDSTRRQQAGNRAAAHNAIARQPPGQGRSSAVRRLGATGSGMSGNRLSLYS